MQIRKLISDDAEAYQRLILEGLKQFPIAFGASYEESVDEPIAQVAKSLQVGGNFGAFEDDGKLLGIVGIRQETLLKMRHKAVVWGFYVSAVAQGRGIGRQLLQTALYEARSMSGVEQVTLMVAEDSVGPQRLYESFGFERYGIEPRELKFDGQYYNTVLMWLKL
jgi:ribosomal protein S18 acetylase RimI-like enzyme